MATLTDQAKTALEQTAVGALSLAMNCLSLGAELAESTLEVLDTSFATEAEQTIPDGDEDVGSEWHTSARQMWESLRPGFNRLCDIASTMMRIALSLFVASVLYALPVWGTTLYTPLHFLPGAGGTEVTAEVAVGHWAASSGPGFAVVDIDLQLKVPSALFNGEAQKGQFRVDLEVAGFEVSRALLLAPISPAALRIRELLLALPVALELCSDEQTVILSLVSDLAPEELISQRDIAASASTPLGGIPSPARLRFSPVLVASHAEVAFRLRPPGPLGRLLSRPWGFIPFGTLVLYWLFFSRRIPEEENDPPLAKVSSVTDSAVAEFQGCTGGNAGLTLAEAEMLAKALWQADAAVAIHFSQTLAEFETEDVRLNGQLIGQVKRERLPDIVLANEAEWQAAGLGEGEARRFVAATLRLSPTAGGLVTPDAMLCYRPWLAVLVLSLLRKAHEVPSDPAA